MFDFFGQITLEHFYIGCASIGGALFLVRVLLLIFAGGHGDVDAGGDLGGDIGGDVGGDVGGDIAHDLSSGHGADASFKMMSLQGVTAFFMMFGLVGWAILKQAPEGATWNVASFLGGALAGLGTMWVLAMIFFMMQKLQSTGALNLQEAIGDEGMVYLTIPADGMGKVRINARGGLKEFDAVAADKQEVKTGQRVKVVGLVETNVLVVQKI